ncbi:MAG TPA: signal peptide peptidase SppA [Saprospiraceae bacterium]|nr:signal peptide peptidase SppA [Saprospiraceae bacterium]
MKDFFKFIFASCLGTFLALILIFFVSLGVIGSFASKSFKNSTSISEQSVLKISIPASLPEQTNNIPMEGLSFNEEKVLGIHDYAKAIRFAATDSKIKGIYITNPQGKHGLSSLKVIRDALNDFKASGKFIIAYHNYLDHNSYFISSVADQILIHPLGFTEMRGFGASIPFYKELMEKIGLKFNIYYAGQFKSATEPFRLEKMSTQNREQLSEYLNSQYQEYIQQVADSRKLSVEALKSDFDFYKSSSPEKAKENKIVDEIAYETDAILWMKNKIGIGADDKLQLVNPTEYFANLPSEDYSIQNKVAVLYAEGDIIDNAGREGEIGRKYINQLREIRKNKNIKALVLRVNSPGGSAGLSDEFLHEIDLIKASGKPVVASMGDYAASGGYYISCHSDSIFASRHCLTGSIGVFAMIPNLSTMTDQKIGVDFDTIGTGPMATKFSLFHSWGDNEGRIIQNNIDHTYDRFLQVVSEGRKMDKTKVHEIAQGHIWLAPKAKSIGLVNEIGELKDAINCAARMASLDRFRVAEYPTQKEALEKFIDRFQNKDSETKQAVKEYFLRTELGEFYPYYQELKNISAKTGVQMRLPYKIEIR